VDKPPNLDDDKSLKRPVAIKAFPIEEPPKIIVTKPTEVEKGVSLFGAVEKKNDDQPNKTTLPSSIFTSGDKKNNLFEGSKNEIT
jgi:hypothetical protein